eukprot:m.38918 g.38918  ORF g.38918 m.38918 type:complete len:84 (+) comp6825_c0_seq1:1623-1874(+)
MSHTFPLFNIYSSVMGLVYNFKQTQFAHVEPYITIFMNNMKHQIKIIQSQTKKQVTGSKEVTTNANCYDKHAGMKQQPPPSPN